MGTPPTKKKERWKAIPGYEGFYAVSSLGRVKSKARKVKHRDIFMSLPEKIMKPWTCNGYACVTLYKERKARKELVHRLVLEAFVGPCPPGMEGCHFPQRDPSNNTIGNLVWGTSGDNHNHMKLQGTSCRCKSYEHVPKGEAHPHAKLTRAKVRKIRKRLRSDRSRGALGRTAEEFGVSLGAVSDVFHNRTWKGV